MITIVATATILTTEKTTAASATPPTIPTTTSTTSTTTSTTSTTTSTTSTTTSTTSTTTSTTSTTTATTSTVTTATTTPIPCNYSRNGLLQEITNFPPLIWTLYNGSFVATSTTTILRFTSATANINRDWYVDNVTVVSSSDPSTNLIANSNFESGASSGWQVSSCGGPCTASIRQSTSCLNSTGWCYDNACPDTGNLQFLQESFATVV
ncbi:unnamed protein product, partial [Rotaria sp. Silwood2]